MWALYVFLFGYLLNTVSNNPTNGDAFEGDWSCCVRNRHDCFSSQVWTAKHSHRASILLPVCFLFFHCPDLHLSSMLNESSQWARRVWEGQDAISQLGRKASSWFLSAQFLPSPPSLALALDRFAQAVPGQSSRGPSHAGQLLPLASVIRLRCGD